jgi:cytochrome d ubiquinol oxidase subunit I
MNGTELLAFVLLGAAMLVHVVLVNITIGTGWISALMRFLGWRRGDDELETLSRRVLKILIVIELFSGVWGTVITIVLAGLFPTLMAMVTDILYYPILISLSSIFIRIPTIALFWYTWGKVKPSVHSAIGFVMALSGFLIPFGFRFIFSEITYPYAIVLASQGLRDVARMAVFSNPLFPALLLHTWMGALSIGGFVVTSFFATKKNVNAKFGYVGLRYGIVFLVAQGVTGPTYFLALSNYAPLLFANVMGTSSSTADFSYAFVVKMGLVTTLAVVAYKVWTRVRKGHGVMPRYALALAPLAISAAVAGETINDGGRYPYVVLSGWSGLPVTDFVNVYSTIPIEIVYIIVVSLFLIVGAFVVATYYALNKGLLAEASESSMT